MQCVSLFNCRVNMLEAEIASALKGYGNLYRRYIANALFVIRIFGLHMMKSYRTKGTVQLGKKAGKRAI